MRVLITGANGFLGRHVVRAVADRGHQVRALVRSTANVPRWPDRVETVVGDLRRRDLSSLVADIDAVIHLAASVRGDDETQFINTVVATENLLEAVRLASIDRFVLCSSFAVYDWRRASDLLDEETPLESDLYARDGYAIAKSWQEKLVRRYAAQHGWQLTVLRPGFLWGPENPWIAGTGHSFGKWHVVIGGGRELPITYVANCAECIAIAVDHPAAAGETFNVVDDERVTAWRYMGRALRATGTAGRRIYVPYWFGLALATVASWIGRLIFGVTAKLPGLLVPIRYRARFRPLRFTSQKVQTRLGWRPRWSFADAWQRAAEPATNSEPARSGAKEVAID
jgi:UDP-glucose 4-epimerase